ncbi:MAG: hypothetical protein ACLQGP_18460 [Isosphaeraceae bacterium]
MTRSAKSIASGCGWAIGVGMAALALAQAPPGSPDVPTIAFRDILITDILGHVAQLGLIQMELVQQELKMTDAQKKEQAAILEGLPQRLLQAHSKGARAFIDMIKDSEAKTLANLKPDQRERLEQIKFQVDGPDAFTPRGGELNASEPNLPERLKMSEDQVRQVRAIVKEGKAQIEEAATFAIPLDPDDRLPTIESVSKLIDGPKFRAAKQAAREAAYIARARLIRRIEDEVLNGDQRAAYRKRLGGPIDLARLTPRQDERSDDFDAVTAALGIGGRQSIDPDFNARVARPAYADAAPHPRVIFDEAHRNWYSAVGSFSPFANLLSNDGYRVIRNRETYTREVLRTGDILIIADAARASGPRGSKPKPEYTDAECDAIRDWVKNGGALLLIIDAPRSGGAAENLARRFGVDLSNRLTSDPVNSVKRNSTWLILSRQNQLLRDHPITRGRDVSERLDRIQTFDGTSLKGPEGSIPFLKLGATAVDRVGRSNDRVPASGRAQGLAFRFGQGRVVVLGGAGAFTAEIHAWETKMGMNVPGIDNHQMALNIMHWLSGLLEPREAALKKAG